MALRKVQTSAIADNAITTAKIASGAVTAADLNADVNNVINNVTVDTVFTGDSITIPAGTTAQRPASASVGMIRYNTSLGFMEQYTGDGWQGVAPPPTVTTVSPTTYNGEQGTTFTVNGSNFDSTVTVKFITAQGAEYSAATVSRVNASQLTATTPQDFTVANEPLKLKIINGSGLAYTLDNAIDCGGVPNWVTTAGSVASVSDNWDQTFTNSYGTLVTLSATDPEGASVSYNIVSGVVPSGTSFNQSTGVISGTPNEVATSTTSNFSVTAIDNANNTTERAFSLTVVHTPHLYTNDSNIQNVSLDDSGSQNLINSTVRDGSNPAEILDWTDTSTYGWHYSPFTNGATSTFKINVSSVYTNGVRINKIVNVPHANNMGGYTFYGSQDGSTWTDLGTGHFGGTQSGGIADGGKIVNYINNNKAWKYYKIEFVNNSTNLNRLYDNSAMGGGWATYGMLFQSTQYNEHRPSSMTRTGTAFQYSGGTLSTTPADASGTKLICPPYGFVENFADVGMIPANGTTIRYDLGSSKVIDAVSLQFCANGADRGGDLELFVSNDNSTYTKVGSTIALRTFAGNGTGGVTYLTRPSETNNNNYAGEYIYDISGFASQSARTARYIEFRFGGNTVNGHHPRWSTVRVLQQVKVR